MIKTMANWCLYLIALVVLFEALLSGYYYVSSDQIIYLRDAKAGSVPTALQLPGAVFQPYTGYTLREGRTGAYLEEGDWIATNFGFQNMVKKGKSVCCDYPHVAAENDYVVGIFGGSVGSGFALQAQADGSFAEVLKDVPDIADKNVVVLNFSQPGFRQPQQLTTLAYFLSIGQTFDLVLNIDGFNEVVTSWKNWSDGAEPSFPADSLWGAWGRQLEQQKVPVAQRGFHLANYHTLAVRASKDREDACVTAICYYRYKIAGLYHGWRAGAERASLPEKSEQRSLFPTKTVSELPDPFDLFGYTADLWRRSSLGMAELSKVAGARYIHVLQPNQWFDGAGQYTPIKVDHVYKWVIAPVNKGYRKLLTQSLALEAAGVNFLDGSLLFKSVPERSVYVDDCCHFTPQGYHAIFRAVAENLNSTFASGN